MISRNKMNYEISTFAWWGAFLGAGTEGVIVAPRIWQGNRPTEKDPLYLKNMILL